MITQEAVEKLDECLLELDKATQYTSSDESDHAIKEMIAIRKATAALAFQMYRKHRGDMKAGMQLWKQICAGDEFVDVKNEWWIG